MGEAGRASLEAALSRHYDARRQKASLGEVSALAAKMVAEDARCSRGRDAGMGHVAFVAAQVRFIPVWVWAAQLALVAVMGALSHMAGGTDAARVSVGMLSAMTTLVGVPTMHASRLHRVAELEYACPNNAASVLVARLIVLGCSSALSVALMVALLAASTDAGAFEVALWAAPPYFLSCAGSLMVLRKAPPSMAAALCVVWALTCCGGLALFACSVPLMYAHASLVVWACAAAAALAWLVREVMRTYGAAVLGLDAFSPHMAMTNN